MSKPIKGVEKLRLIRNELKAEVVERGVEIDLLFACIIGRVHMVLLGEPGVAKSMMIDQFLSHVEGASLFSHLLNKQTPPEAIFGPISMKGLENDEFRRVTTAKLPEAHIGFVDEIFKSNSTILNAMLKLINERMFENGGALPQPVPLWSLIGASNELPTHDREDLVAFSDRLGVRRLVQPVRTQDGIMQILNGQLSRGRGDLVADTHTVITKDDIEDLQQQAVQVTLPNRVQQRLVDLRMKAEQEGLRLSMRRMFEGVKLCQAQALLTDRTEIKAEDLRLFEHVLWNDPEDIAVAQELTLDFAGAVGKIAARSRSSYDELAKRLSKAQSQMPQDVNEEPAKETVNELTTVSAQLRKLDSDIEQNITDAQTDGHDPSELESIAADVQRARHSVREALGMEF